MTEEKATRILGMKYIQHCRHCNSDVRATFIGLSYVADNEDDVRNNYLCERCHRTIQQPIMRRKATW